MNRGFRTSDGLSVWVGWDEENGWYEAFAHDLMEKCYIPHGRGRFIDAAIRDLEASIAAAPAEWALCEDEAYMAAWNAEWATLIDALQDRLSPSNRV